MINKSLWPPPSAPPEALTPALARADPFLALDPHHDPRNKKAEATVRTAIPIDHALPSNASFPHTPPHPNRPRIRHPKEKVIAITRDYFHDLDPPRRPPRQTRPHQRRQKPPRHRPPPARPRTLSSKYDPAVRPLFIARITIARHYAPDPAWPTPSTTPNSTNSSHGRLRSHKRSLRRPHSNSAGGPPSP